MTPSPMLRVHVEFVDRAYLAAQLVRPERNEQSIATDLAFYFENDSAPANGRLPQLVQGATHVVSWHGMRRA